MCKQQTRQPPLYSQIFKPDPKNVNAVQFSLNENSSSVLDSSSIYFPSALL